MENKSNLFWRTKDGILMDVDDMSDTHVRNAFKMLLRSIYKAQEESIKNRNKFELNGDMAGEFNDSHHCDEEDYYDSLCQEEYHTP